MNTPSRYATSCNVLFFSIVLLPPRSPLFPYTTLFRSARRCRGPPPGGTAGGVVGGFRRDRRLQQCHLRSEEHTSELQSHSDLVCRLLLEIKKIHGSSSCRVR